jgi:4-hydroxybutyrate CoA-transferase
MTWTDQFKQKVVSPAEAVKAVKSGNRIFLTGNCSVPSKILSALVDRGKELKDVEINQALTVGSADYVSPEMEGQNFPFCLKTKFFL